MKVINGFSVYTIENSISFETLINIFDGDFCTIHVTVEVLVFSWNFTSVRFLFWSNNIFFFTTQYFNRMFMRKHLISRSSNETQCTSNYKALAWNYDFLICGWNCMHKWELGYHVVNHVHISLRDIYSSLFFLYFKTWHDFEEHISMRCPCVGV